MLSTELPQHSSDRTTVNQSPNESTPRYSDSVHLRRRKERRMGSCNERCSESVQLRRRKERRMRIFIHPTKSNIIHPHWPWLHLQPHVCTFGFSPWVGPSFAVFAVARILLRVLRTVVIDCAVLQKFRGEFTNFFGVFWIFWRIGGAFTFFYGDVVVLRAGARP